MPYVSLRTNTLLSSYYNLYGIAQNEISAIHQYFMGPDFWGNLSEYQFFFGPGIPHPNQLEGCEFLASQELTLLLNLDLCSTDNDFFALRMVCAISCKCSDLPINCPSSCIKS